MIKVNSHPVVEWFTFSGGEEAPRLPDAILPNTPVVEVTVHGAASQTLMGMILVVDALRRRNPLVQLDLFIPYLPYARQDRVCNDGEPLSVAAMGGLINSLGFRTVRVFDCHSDVGAAVVHNCHNVHVAQILAAYFPLAEWSGITLVAPDAGAVKKTYEAAKHLGAAGVVCCSKIRDTRTGRITETAVHDDVFGKQLLVVDDIFDGGRTFTELGKVLRDLQPAAMDLWVTHGIFSKGYTEVAELYRNIYSTNSFHHAAKGNTRPDGIVDPQFSFFEI